MDHKSIAKAAYSQIFDSSFFDSLSKMLGVDIHELFKYDCLNKDSLFAEAGLLVIENQKGSIGYLQRNFRIGFNRAARIMDQLAEAGVVGPECGTIPREIKMTIYEFERLLNH